MIRIRLIITDQCKTTGGRARPSYLYIPGSALAMIP
jgi:hypothetical protein